MNGMSDSISLDSAVETRSRFDVATYVAAAVFNTAALPPGMPDFLKQAVESAAARERQMPGAANADTVVADTKEEREKKASDRASDQVQWIAREQQQEREREEWAQTTHSFAGATMTGTEWGDLGKDLKQGGALRDWLIAELMRKGITGEEALKKADEIADVAAIMSKPKAQWTAAEREKMERAKADPTIQDVMPKLEEEKRALAAGANRTQSQHADRSLSIDDGAAVFASAPALGDHHKAALAAVLPLDASKPALPITSPAPQPGMAGLDV